MRSFVLTRIDSLYFSPNDWEEVSDGVNKQDEGGNGTGEKRIEGPFLYMRRPSPLFMRPWDCAGRLSHDMFMKDMNTYPIHPSSFVGLRPLPSATSVTK